MRWLLLLTASGVCACTGGQTGEITDETACTEPTEVTLDEARRARVEQLGQPWTGTLAWEEDGSTTELTVSHAIASGAVTELRGEGCERPLLVVPVELRLDSTDGRLAETLVGDFELREGADQAAIRASRPLAEVEGTFDASWLGPLGDDARLVAALTRDEGSSSGQLFVAPGDGGDELHAAAW